MKYEQNQRMPWSRQHWAPHTHRMMRLNWEQRGLLDEIRGELWSVVGVKMLRPDLMTRMHIKPKSKGERLIDWLVAHGLLDQDNEGWISDEVLTSEWAWAVQTSATNRANASKSRKPQVAPVVPQGNPHGNDHDF